MQDSQSRLKRIVRAALSFAFLAALLFVPAGRIDWWEGWQFLLFFTISVSVLLYWIGQRDPALIAERMKVADNVEKWDNAIITLYTILLIVLLVLAGFDSGRLNWSIVPITAKLGGWMGNVLALAIIWWTMATNTYLSERVRIQDDRGQQVISSGPYRFVRHPMYVGVIIFIICLPIILGSWWALVPGGLIVILFVIRTVLEDRTLINKLPGYLQYSEQVRYRLIPGIW